MNRYVKSFRPRTLPLSMSGIILGSGLAYPVVENKPRFWVVFALAIATTLSLQILANIANELGDADHGTDDNQAGREAYGLQSGAITKQEMIRCMYCFVALCICFGTALVWTSFRTLLCLESVIFLLLGAFAIGGAIKYTYGKHNYGYVGLGDLGVFIFFGLLSTMGSYYLQAHTLTLDASLCAVAIAMPIVGVLNLNNIRDIDNDKKHGKNTFAGLLGVKGGKIYHTVLMIICFGLFAVLRHYWTLLAIPIIVWHLIYIWQHEGATLDRQMPVLMFTTIGIAMLACIV